jgi:hypothetical protein
MARDDRCSAMTAPSSHLPASTKFWTGLRWTPASTVIGSQVFRCSPLSRPRMTPRPACQSIASLYGWIGG